MRNNTRNLPLAVALCAAALAFAPRQGEAQSQRRGGGGGVRGLVQQRAQSAMNTARRQHRHARWRLGLGEFREASEASCVVPLAVAVGLMAEVATGQSPGADHFAMHAFGTSHFMAAAWLVSARRFGITGEKAEREVGLLAAKIQKISDWETENLNSTNPSDLAAELEDVESQIREARSAYWKLW